MSEVWEVVRPLLGVVIGGAIAIVGSLIAESKRAQRDREAWERAQAAERRLRYDDRQRVAIEELQDLVYSFFGQVDSAAIYIVQRDPVAMQDEYVRERQRAAIAAEDRAGVLIDRIPDRLHGTLLLYYFKEPWFLRIKQDAAAVADGPDSIANARAAVAQTLRDAWLALDRTREEWLKHDPDQSSDGTGTGQDGTDSKS